MLRKFAAPEIDKKAAEKIPIIPISDSINFTDQEISKSNIFLFYQWLNFLISCNLCLFYFVVVEGYIKDVITQNAMPFGNKISQGCLSDPNSFKLEIRSGDLGDMKHYEIGAFLKIKGVIKWCGSEKESPYLWFENQGCIEHDASKNLKSLINLFRGWKILKRPQTEQTVNNTVSIQIKLCKLFTNK